MNLIHHLNNLNPPKGPIDVVLDTDAYNEIDDQFAISYMLCWPEKLRIQGICAAPFDNIKSTSPEDGMERSYDEIIKLLSLAHCDELKKRVYKGSRHFLENEQTPVCSEAASFMAELADAYTEERPLYIVAIGAITNVASALLLNPSMKDKCVIVWLGGNAWHYPDNQEFNICQDVAAARVVFGCGVPFVQLPCCGVVDHLSTSRYELEYWLKGKNPLCDYLVENTVAETEFYVSGKPWTRVIWDVSAVAWLLNDHGRFMQDMLLHSPIPEYDHHYSQNKRRHFMKYVFHIDRDAIFEDMFLRLGNLPYHEAT